MIDFPVYFRIGGIDVAIVPAETLKALMQGLPEALESMVGEDRLDEVDAAILKAMLQGRGGKSPILYDRALSRYLINALKSHRQTDVLGECRKRFGPDRTPSSTALNRFAIRVRSTRHELVRQKAA